MEFPARPLNARDFEYNTDDCYSTLTKPYTVTRYRKRNSFSATSSMTSLP